MSSVNPTPDPTTLYCTDCETHVRAPNILRQYNRPHHRGCGAPLERLPLGGL